MKLRAIAAAALLIAAIVGCDGTAVEPNGPVHLASVDTLHPGEIATLRGTGLTHVHALELDGIAATDLLVNSDSVAHFRVPTLRSCETDMRTVKVSAAGGTIDGVIRVGPSFSLKPAESRVLTENDLHCLRIPATNEDYVLSAANLAIPFDEVESPRMLLGVHLLGSGTGTSVIATGMLAQRAAVMQPPLDPVVNTAAAFTGGYSATPTPFDPRYATAVVGDTLRFVDWYAADPETVCNASPTTVPSFKAKVVALSGNVVVVVDLRHFAASRYLDPTQIEWLREAGAMTDRLLLRTMRSVFNPDYVPPAGGGGRYFVMLGSLPAAFNGFTGYAYDGPLPAVSVASQAKCPRASEMVVTSLSADKLPGNAANAAGLFLHEYAHNADLLSSGRDRTASVLNEGLATLAEETASRIASSQPVNAVHSRVHSDAPMLTSAAYGMWGTSPELGPWQSNGRYGANARMLLFMRELAGEASVNHGRRPTLYQQLISAQIDWLNRPAVIATITSVLGISYADLIDRQSLASVTAGLIDPDVPNELPRYTSWDHSERASDTGPRSPLFPTRVNRRVDSNYTLAAADGAHAALYFMADGPRGVSVQVTSIAPNACMIRLTRLR